MPEYLAPGVFVEETSFRSKTIEGVSTTTTGFIGPARFGPIHLEPDIVTSLTEFEQTFDPFGGGSELNFSGISDVPNFLWHAVRAFFTEGGKRLYISRVFKRLQGDYAPIGDTDDAGAATRVDQLYADGHARVDSAATGGVRIRARHPGAAANLRVRVSLKGSANVLVAGEPDPVSGAATATLRSVTDLDLVWLRSQGTSPSGPATGAFYLAHWNEDDAIRQLEPMTVTSPSPFLDGGLTDVSSLNTDPRPDQGDSVRVVTLQVSLLTRDGSRELATWSGLPLDPRHRSSGSADSVFARFGNTPFSSADARHLPLVFGRDPSQVAHAFDVLQALFGSDPTEHLEPTADEIRRGITPGDKLALGVAKPYQLEGGNDGLRPEAGEFEGEADLRKGYSLGLKQFEDIEDISIVAAPGVTWNYADYRDDANAITGLLISHAERMRYRIAVLDSAEHQTVSDVRGDARQARLQARRALLPVGHGPRPGHRARSSTCRRAASSPASTPATTSSAASTRRRPTRWCAWRIGFETLLNKGQQEVLNPEGINCFRFFEGRGIRLWGARTISSDPEWKYVNLRRYFAYLEHSIDKGTQWAVFEPNGERLWANVRRTIEDFLFNEWQSGALLGDKPEQGVLRASATARR